jgi:hypothetical protein
MVGQQVLTTGGLVLDDATVQDLKASVRGALLRPGDDGYQSARKVWNGMPPRRAARCASWTVMVSPQMACPLHATSPTGGRQAPTPDQSYSMQSG